MNPALLALILTQAQAHWLSVSYNIGAEHGYPYTIAALIWQESSFCARTHHHDHAYGCGGIHLDTAALVEQRPIRGNELEDPQYNIRVTGDYFHYCLRRMGEWRKAIGCYHYGYPVASKKTDLEHDPYVLSVAAKVRALEGVKQNHD